MSFESNLQHILSSLSEHKGDKGTIMEEAIVRRLEKSYSSYKHDIEQNVEYLRHRNEIKLLNKINRSRGNE